MIKYSDITEAFNEHTLQELIFNYTKRQRLNKELNESVAKMVVEELSIDSDALPGSYTTKLGILLSALLGSGSDEGMEIARKILNLYDYRSKQEIIVATQYIDQYQTNDIDITLFSYVMNGLISVFSITEKPELGFSLDTDFGNINVAAANEVLDIPEIPSEERRQLCHQITSKVLFDYPNLYGAYYYIPQAFKGSLEHSVLIDEDDNLVIDLANNAAMKLDIWKELYGEPVFVIKGKEFRELYKKILDEYNEHIHMAAIEEARRIRKQNR